jgi:hypothetical protein
MNRLKTAENPHSDLEDFLVGKFSDRQEAEIAAKFLEEASFSAEQIQI